jgi:dihydroorotate dehydrogenase (NAD+) catalytic subunit
MSHTTTSVELAGHTLRSPVLLAAGTCGVLDEMRDVLDLRSIGGLVTKSITRRKREGNPYPRITWTRSGMINAIGLANPGLDGWQRDVAPRIKDIETRIIGSIAGDSIEDYVEVARAMDACEGLDLVELNVSCPNVHSGLEFGADPGALRELVSSVRDTAPGLDLIVKLSPIVVGTPHTIVDLSRVAIESGAKALTLTNTVPAMGIDVHTREPILANTTGGLSGPAIHPIVVRLVHLVYTQYAKDAGVDIIAAGGVTRWEDAAEFILAGATAAQIGAGSFADPKIGRKVDRGLAKWMHAQGATNYAQLRGAIKRSS